MREGLKSAGIGARGRVADLIERRAALRGAQRYRGGDRRRCGERGGSRERHFLCALRQPRRPAKRGADELTREFDELLQPRRLSPMIRSSALPRAAARSSIEALHDPAWGALIARGAMAMPDVARVARGRPNEDVRRAARADGLATCRRNCLRIRLGIRAAMQSAARRVGSPSRRRFRRRDFARDRRVSRGSSTKCARVLANLIGEVLIRDARQRNRDEDKVMAINIARFTTDGGPRWGVAQETASCRWPATIRPPRR